MNIDIDVPDGKSNDWEVSIFTVTEEKAKLFNLSEIFSGSGRVIDPGTYKRLTWKGKAVMSNTPSEIRDHVWFIMEAKNAEVVLINGLGLGVALKEILTSETVKEVTVIEKSSDVLYLVGPTYIKDRRVNIIQADAYEYQPPKGKRYNVVWHDIWDDICSDNLPQMHKLHRKYGRRCDWQGSWGRPEAERQLREWKKEKAIMDAFRRAREPISMEEV